MAEAGTRDVLVSVKRGAEILRSGYFSLKLSWTLQEAFTFILEHHLPQHVVARKLQGLSLEDVLLYDRNDELLLHRGAEGPGVHGLAHSTVGTVCQQGWHAIRFMTTQDRPPPTPSEVTVTPTALNTWLPPRKNNAIITTPSANLAYNHARASLASFDIGFSPLSASGKAAVQALADVVYYLDHGRGTVASRYHSLNPTLRDLGLFFFPEVLASGWWKEPTSGKTPTEDEVKRACPKFEAMPGFRLVSYHPRSGQARVLHTHKSDHERNEHGRVSFASPARLARTLNDCILGATWLANRKELLQRENEWADGNRLYAFYNLVFALARILDMYATFLRGQHERTRLNHAETAEDRQKKLDDNFDLKVKAPVAASSVGKEYRPIAAALEGKGLYEPVDVGDIVDMWVGDKTGRWRGVAIGVKILTCKIVTGGTKVPNVYYVWKADEDHDDHHSLNATCIVQARRAATEYANRSMLKAVAGIVQSVGSITAKGFKVVYETLTGRIVSQEHAGDRGLLDAIEFAAASGDQEMVQDLLDMRRLNEGNKAGQKHVSFFQTAVGMVDEELKPQVAPNRHGGEFTHKSVDISQRSFYRRVVDKFKAKQQDGEIDKDQRAPSYGWFLYQFLPTYPLRKAGALYRGIIKLVPKILSRSFRPQHPDKHFCGALVKNLKAMYGRLWQHAVLISFDDKNRVPVGDPGRPKAVIERQRRGLVAQGQQLVAMDHDAGSGVCNLVPTVTLIVQPLAEEDGSIYRGDVKVCFKSAVSQHSSAMRTVTELHQRLEKHLATEREKDAQYPKKSVLLMMADGGHEHNMRNGSVQVSLASLFLNGDWDMVVAVRTAPGHSWENPVERIMAILNIAFNGVAVEREAVEGETKDGEAWERVVLRCNSQAELRAAMAENTGLRAAVEDALQQPIILLSERTHRLSLIDRPFEVVPPAKDAEIEEMFAAIRAVDPALVMTDTTQAKLAARAEYQAFVRRHVILTKYGYVIWKVCWREYLLAQRRAGQPLEIPPSEEEQKKVCPCCKPPRMPLKEFLDELAPIPMPILSEADDKVRYLPFAHTYNKKTEHWTDQRGCPTVKEAMDEKEKNGAAGGDVHAIKATQHPTDHELTRGTIQGQRSGGKAVGTLTCVDCAKPRLVFYRTGNTEFIKTDAEALVARSEEDGTYVCGQDFPEVWEKGDGHFFVLPRHMDAYLSGQPIAVTQYEKFIATRAHLTCDVPMERDFYEAGLDGAALKRCYYCGGECNPGGGDVMVPGWSKAFPFCDGCKDLGRKQPVYRQKHAPDEAAREAAAGKKAARKRAGEGAAKAAGKKKRSKKAAAAEEDEDGFGDEEDEEEEEVEEEEEPPRRGAAVSSAAAAMEVSDGEGDGEGSDD